MPQFSTYWHPSIFLSFQVADVTNEIARFLAARMASNGGAWTEEHSNPQHFQG